MPDLTNALVAKLTQIHTAMLVNPKSFPKRVVVILTEKTLEWEV